MAFCNIRADYKRYRECAGDGPAAAIRAALQYGFLATLVYRYGRWARGVRPRILSLPFKLHYALLQFFVDVMFGINITTNADIGPGLHIGHFGGIFLHGDMGAGCSVAQNVTVGYKGAGKSSRPPTIGDHVYIGCGAVLIGEIRVGDRSVIGANATVVSDVPDGATIVGPKAHIVERKDMA